MEFRVSEGKGDAVENMPMEIVERKGKGHPDSLCDGAAEQLCVVLCKYYIEKCGRILHHNVDKCVLVGGQSEAKFGGGIVVKPIYLLLVGRAAEAPVEEFVQEKIPQWFGQQVPHLNSREHLVVEQKVRPGSADLVGIFERSAIPRANDTSFAVGFAPLSETERLVRETELYLNSPACKAQLPQVGEDVKVMGVRDHDTIRLTVAAAFLAEHVENLEEYYQVKKQVAEAVLMKVAANVTRRKVEVFINTADDDDNPYLTVTGTSAECGDDGQVGRGNRANGLITPYRPMTLEAVAGKNPVSHVGKIYNIMARLIAERVYAHLKPDVDQVYCYLVSSIGHPITDPQAVHVELYGKTSPQAVSRQVRRVVDETLGSWQEIQMGFVEGQWEVY